MHKRSLMCILLGASAVAVVGCAQDVGDIDRTGPNKLRKEVLLGDPKVEGDEPEWYMRETVVGASGTSITTFVGLEGDVERVKFAIGEEGELYAYRVHEDLIGIDTLGAPTTGTGWDGIKHGNFKGAVVGKFGIRGHFDVQRQYNSSTGEQTNVIVENSSDRHWNERQFFRIDWQNELATWSGNAMIEGHVLSGHFEYGDTAEPARFECRDANGQWFDCTGQDLTAADDVGYIEATSTYVVEPDWVECALTTGLTTAVFGGGCGPETVKVRLSLQKVYEDKVQAYEPRVYTDKEMEWFGFFRTERCAYDRLYGCRDQGHIALAQRHNIWTRWYEDLDGDRQYNEDVDRRLPYSEREAQPIVYYLSKEYPVDLMDESLDIANQYNDIFVEAVQASGAPFDANARRMFYLCANNEAQVEGLPENLRGELMRGYADGFCDRPGRVKELGDIRYGYFAWVDEASWNGPLGYGPSTVDPVTGEILAGNAYIYGASIDIYAQLMVDYIDLVNGEMTGEEYGTGQNLDAYLTNLYKKLGLPKTGFTAAGASGGITPDDLKRFEELSDKIEGVYERRAQWEERGIAPGMIKPAELIRHQDTHIAIWERLKGTEHEIRFLVPDLKVALGMGLFGPEDPTTEETIELIGPRRIHHTKPNGLDVDALRAGRSGRPYAPKASQVGRDYWKRMHMFAGRNCMFMGEFIDDALLGTATRLASDYGHIEDDLERRLQMFYDMRGLIFKHVMEHEVGHTVGLRHNFGASYDAMSYQPEYWRIRAEGDQELAALNRQCPTLEGTGVMLGDAHCVSRGVINQDWQKGMQEYAYASTMDYGGNMLSQSHGLGLYDKAALAYGYTELVHVFAEDSVPTKFRVRFDNEGGGLVRDGSPSIEVGSTPITDWDDIEEATLTGSSSSDVLNAGLDFWHFSVLPLMFGGDMERAYNREWVSITDYNPSNPSRLRVPYRFCEDFLRGSNPYCNVWDDGADIAQQIQRYRSDYNVYYFANAYRRGRSGFGLWLWPYISRMMNRYFMPMATLYQHWLIRASQWDFWYVNPYGGGAYTQIAIEEGMREMLDVLAAPHPGTYAMVPVADPFTTDNQGRPVVRDTYINLSSNTGVQFSGSNGPRLDLEVGGPVKWRFGRYEYDSGYYWFFQYSILSSFYDRYAAFEALTNPAYNDIGVDAGSDISAYMIPYYLLYSTELSNVFGGIMTEDWSAFAPLVRVADFDSNGGTADALEFRDPFAGPAKRNAYRDPTQYVPVNPYAASYNNAGFNDRYYAAIYGLSMFQVLWDLSFNHASNIQYVNNGGFGTGLADSDGDGVFDIEETDEGMFDPNITTRTGNVTVSLYTDPFNRQQYAAVQYRQVRSPLFSVAAKTLQRANVIKKCYENPNWAPDVCAALDVNEFDVQQVREDIEIILDLNRVFAPTVAAR